MALTKPILNQIPAWDLTKGHSFTFNAIGGDRFVGSTLNIKNPSSGALIASHRQVSNALENTLPPNFDGLSNGGYYLATIQTENASGQLSAESNGVLFYCYSTPTITISGFGTSAPTLDSSTYPFTATYRQSEGEDLNTYKWILYDVNEKEIVNSGMQYAANLNPRHSGSAILYTLDYTFSGFENGGVYYIEIIADTINGTRVSTGKKMFYVRYTSSAAYAQITATNDCEHGYITINSRAVALTGRASSGAVFTEDNTAIILTGGQWVTFDKGYKIPDDFTMKMWFKGYSADFPRTIINVQDGMVVVDLCRNEADNTLYCKVTVNKKYIIYSNETPFTQTQTLCAQVRKLNNIYEAKLDWAV